MGFIKNFPALIVSTVVWMAGLVAILSVYYIAVEQDIFYFFVLLLSVLVIAAGVIFGRYNVRVQTALEIPMGILGL